MVRPMFTIPLTLEEQLIVRIYSIVGPNISIASNAREEMWEDIALAVNSYARAKELDIYESREDDVSSDTDISGL